MILPTKRLTLNRSIFGFSGIILQQLTEPKPISRIWDELKKSESANSMGYRTTYDWFVLGLDFLYLLGVIEIDDGIVRKVIQ